MIHVTLTVAAFDRFLETFRTDGLVLRERHGSRGARVFRHAEDASRVTIEFDWDHDRFRAFLADPEVQTTMKSGGTLGPPEVSYLEPAVPLSA